MPTTCAWASEGAAPCAVGKKCDRRQKTGPCHPVCVLRCATHCVCFTVYPPGHVPHGRRAVINLALDGSDPDDGDADDADVSDTPGILDGTQLEPAWEAGHGKTWSREYELTVTENWFGTQWRQVERATHLTGVALDVEEPDQITRAEILSIDALRLREGQAMIRRSPGIRTRGLAVVHVLKAALAHSRSLLDRVLVAGHAAGLWGRPFRWLPNPNQLVALIGT